MKINRVDWRCRTPANPADHRLVTGLREGQDFADTARAPGAALVHQGTPEPFRLVQDIELVRSRRTIGSVRRLRRSRTPLSEYGGEVSPALDWG